MSSSLELVGKKIGPIGFGLMGFTWRESPPPQEQAFEAMRAAIANGCTFWNGGEFYGPPEYNSNVLLERYFEKYPEDADKIVLSIKGGADLKTMKPDGTPEGVRRTIDHTIKQLNGRKKLDIFEYARRDQNADFKLTLDTEKAEYLDTGKVGGICLSEVRAETIHEAVKHIKVVGVEVELSLFQTEVLENGVADACAKYNIPLIAYSPIGKGMLSGKIRTVDDIKGFEMLKHFPRFQPENLATNLKLVEQVEAMAKKKGCTPAQLAINWTIALGRRPGMPVIIPIPGATTVERVEENSKLIDITDEEMAEIDETLKNFTTAGARYPDHVPTDT